MFVGESCTYYTAPLRSRSLGLGMLAELARHWYRISSGTLYLLLQGLEEGIPSVE